MDPASTPVTAALALAFGLAPVACTVSVAPRLEWLPTDGRAGAAALLAATLGSALLGLAVLPGATLAVSVPTGADLVWMALAPPLLFGVGLITGVATLRIPFDHFPPQLSGGARTRTGGPGLAVATVLLAGAGEELMFRGVVQTSLAASVGPVVGVGLAAVASGLHYLPAVTRRPRAIDLDGVARLAVTAVGSAVLGVVYVGTDNLLVPIVAHTIHAGALALVRERLQRRAPR
ncbi:hypothetical protein BRC62_05500 [Halobacteriales archaeon QH_10_67_13]|nr:MAG: hypothetical protein BRC62_05500 [Halobacteriales archaeon QH_10_67_13]